MKKRILLMKYASVGIVVLFLFGYVTPSLGRSPLTTNLGIPQKNERIISSMKAEITCYTIGIPGAPPIKKTTVSIAEAEQLKMKLQALQQETTTHPYSAHTQQLQNELLTYAENHQLLPTGVTPKTIQQKLTTQTPWTKPRITPLQQNTASEWFCNFATYGEGSAMPIIILPRFIPILLTPIPRAFVMWSTPAGITSVGGLVSHTGFIAIGQQKGVALGFWGIGFSIFLPPIMSYGIIGYALLSQVTAEYFEFYPPNNPPEITDTDPVDGQEMVPITTSDLRFRISDADGDYMSYSVTTQPDIGSGSGSLKTDGVYSIPISGLQDLTQYTWKIQVSDGEDATEQTLRFTTEAIAPIISNEKPANDERDVPMDITQLQFTLKDYQGDTMQYTVETIPNIGSAVGVNVHDGTYTVPINGLTVGSTYHWFINVTDGTHWTRKIFSFETGYPSQFNPYEYGWQYRKQIMINHTQVLEDLENFPIFIKIVDTDLLKAQNNGGDILFMDKAGVAKRQFHEIDSFDHTSGTLAAWVNIQTLSATQDTILYIYYGNPSCINQQYPKKTWNPDFMAVWHLNTNPSGTIFDSTGKNDGTSNGGMTSTSVVDGAIGKAYAFDGVDDYINAPNSASLCPTSVTALMWFTSDVDTSEKRWTTGKGCEDIWGNDDATTYGLKWYNNRLGTNYETNSNTQTFASGPATLNTWYFSATTFDASTNIVKYYQNGSLCEAINHGQGLRYNTPRDYYIAACYSGTDTGGVNQWVKCVIDEVWILDTAMSEGWMKTLYVNQHDPTSFISIGPEEAGP